MKKLNLHRETLRAMSGAEAGIVFGAGQPRQELVLSMVDPMACADLTLMNACPNTVPVEACTAW